MTSINAESITEWSHLTCLILQVFCGIHKGLVKNKPKCNALFNKNPVRSDSKHTWFSVNLNHHREKVYHLHVLDPVSLNIQLILNHLNARRREREINSELVNCTHTKSAHTKSPIDRQTKFSSLPALFVLEQTHTCKLCQNARLREYPRKHSHIWLAWT